MREAEKLNLETQELLNNFTPFESDIYDRLIDRCGDDLNVLLALVYVSGKSKGVNISMDTIKEYCNENNIHLK